MIIVEGMDNTGKSTVAKLLGDTFQLPVVDRQGRPERDEQVIEQVMSFLLLDPPAILDRHPLISERVYGLVVRKRDIFEPPLNFSFYLERLLRDDPLIVYCRPDLARILNFTKGQMSGVEAHAESLVEFYDHLMDDLNEMCFNIYTYNYANLCEPAPVIAAAATYLKSRGEL